MGRFSRLETTTKNAAVPNEPVPGGVQPWDGPPSPTNDEGSELVDADAAGVVRHGDKAFFAGDAKGALRYYSRAIDKDSRYIEAWTSLIAALSLAGDLQGAYTWIGRGLTIFPNAGVLLALRAVNYARRGMLRQAMNNSDAVLEQHPNEPLAHVGRGEVLLLAENKNADFCFEQAVKLTNDRDWKTPMLIGMICEERRLWARAISYYTVAAQRNERLAGVWYHVGLCRAALGQGTLAQKAYEQATALCEPDDPLRARLENARTGSVWGRVMGWFRKK